MATSRTTVRTQDSGDARNHLTAIVGPNTASFVYGPDGRRTQKAINGTSTQFLYDGLNPVQEIQNGALSANLITGLGIDEYFQRTDSAGARNYVTDILGSTLALTDSSGLLRPLTLTIRSVTPQRLGKQARTRTNSPEGRTTVQDCTSIGLASTAGRCRDSSARIRSDSGVG